MFQCSVATPVVITSVMLQCAVDCTRSLFDLVTVVPRIDCFEQKTFMDIFDYLLDLRHL